MKAHGEYQQSLQAFEDWLEEEQEKLGCYTQLEGDVDMLEETLQKLQVGTSLRTLLAVPSRRRFFLFVFTFTTEISSPEF